MPVLDLAELVKVLEDKFGVSAAAPAMMMAAGAANGAGAPSQAEEKDSFNIEITEAGANKIAVIKVVREITEVGLKDAKDLVDAAPKIVKEAVKKKEAEEIKKKLEDAGAKVTLK
ncbi:50S ribosomal protein L7/L12 [Candidatus Falkowbacteria bacterium CG1_02_37_44]|nr:MAG: 50S ribosomal protein L7/L12 [Candidatus Falkowbacteria bacterium CG1_02_37_44]